MKYYFVNKYGKTEKKRSELSQIINATKESKMYWEAMEKRVKEKGEVIEMKMVHIFHIEIIPN